MFRANTFEPWAIVEQIILLQAGFYLSLCLMVIIFAILFSIPVELSSVISARYFDITIPKGWAVMLAFLLASFSISFMLSRYVVRAKRCLDHVITLYFVHFIIVLVHDGFVFPKTWSFWFSLVGSISAATILAEHLCLKIELRAIDVGFSAASKRKSRSKSSQPRARDNSTFLPSSVSFGASVSGGKRGEESNSFGETIGLSSSHANTHLDVELTSQTFSLLRHTAFDGLNPIEAKSPNPSYSTALNLDRNVEEEGDVAASDFNLNFASQHPEMSSRQTLTEIGGDIGDFGRVDSPSFRALRQSIPTKQPLQVPKNTTSQTNSNNASLPSGMISGFSLPSLPRLPIYSQNSGINRPLNQSFTSLPNLLLLPPSQAGTPLKPMSKTRPISIASETAAVGQNGTQHQLQGSQFGMSLPILPALPPLNSTFSTPMHSQKTSLNTATGNEQSGQNRIQLPQLYGNNQQRLAGQFYAPGLSSLAGTTTATSTQEH